MKQRNRRFGWSLGAFLIVSFQVTFLSSLFMYYHYG